MILADTSIWVDHFRKSDPLFAFLVSDGSIWQHPFVTGELAAGNLQPRARTIALLRSLPQGAVADDDAYYAFIDDNELGGIGIGFVDIHLLHTAVSAPGCKLWTRDRRLCEQAKRFAVAYDP